MSAWGLRLDDRAVLIVEGNRPSFMLLASAERARQVLAKLGPVRLVWRAQP